jgi:hypothetical protein
MGDKKGKPKQGNKQQQKNQSDQQEQQYHYPREKQNRPSSNPQSGKVRSEQQFGSDNPSIVKSEN